MTHNLANRADGSAAMFSVRETPWHKLGAVLSSAPSLSDALSLAGADFEVVKRRLTIAADPAQGLPSCSVLGSYAVTRTDRHDVLGIVGDRYTPLQNCEAFEILRPLLDGGTATLETGGVLGCGEDVWLMAKLGLPESDDLRVLLGDEIAPYFLIANNHSGKRGVLCAITPVRVVCANTLSMAREKGAKAIGRAFTVRHSTNVRERSADAAEQLHKQVRERLARAARQYQLLQKNRIGDSQWQELVLDAAAPLPRPPRDHRDRLAERAWELAHSRRERLTWLWHNGTDHTGDRSAWEAYQAVTESLDHDEDLWSIGRSLDRRVASLFAGRLNQIKSIVLQKLYDHCTRN